MTPEPEDTGELIQVKAVLRKNLESMGAIAARMVVLMKFREAVLPYLPPAAARAALDAFNASLEEAIPLAAEFGSMPAYSDAFFDEVLTTRAAMQRRQNGEAVLDH
ncbi:MULTISPECIES: hypothetical protein [Ralstonia]|uniref:Uncharacterized protein n=1 Tax=Ralstonia edaphi TaxID=3058599 RepID=A0AB72X2N4_9RALS|nr:MULTISPECIES: hypothetical protein [unclassified Ralstonia]TXD63122.1 hypothetical protein FUT88_03840 [Ralstonia sp. TCR112]CAJ0704336.1 hypothetical protein LMG19089_03570 [Ralstonia sp. LMG 6871]CAJ0716712.1 hypothetical protein LMG6871_01886 [Ralstonia sp. LMG 6871]CAJ0742170.1 hypothetical protein R16034_03004 [Ralstonia sp. LMG 6871]